MTTTTKRRLRSKHVALGLTVAAASALTGCAAEPEYAGICVDPVTEERVDDDECSTDDSPEDYDGTGSGFFWFYMATNSTHSVPAVGSSYNPSHGTYKGSSLVSSSRTIQRGGLPSAGSKSMSSFTKSGGFGSSRGVSTSGFRSGGFSS